MTGLVNEVHGPMAERLNLHRHAGAKVDLLLGESPDVAAQGAVKGQHENSHRALDPEVFATFAPESNERDSDRAALARRILERKLSLIVGVASSAVASVTAA